MTSLSHSPTDMPDCRAAVRAPSRASGRRPFKFHGPPEFILTPKPAPGPEVLFSNAPAWTDDAEGAVPVFPWWRDLRITVNKPLKIGHLPANMPPRGLGRVGPSPRARGKSAIGLVFRLSRRGG